MVLVIGGCQNGKREYVKSQLGYAEKDFSSSIADEAKVLYDLHQIAPAYCVEEILPQLLCKEVIICNEVGSGLVPIEKKDREAREAVGRLCIVLAQNAEKVIRVTCGIGMVIKG